MQRRAALKAQAKKAAFRWPSWPALLSAIPIITVALTLMGYGYDLGYLEPFGLSPQALQHGPLDFLLRSTYALVSVVEKSSQLKALVSTSDGIHQIWIDTEWARYAVAAGMTMLVLLAIVLKEADATRKWVTSIASRLSHSRNKLVVAAMAVGRWLRKIRPTRESQFVLGGASAGWIAPPVIGYFLVGALWAMISLMIFVLGAAPLIGMSAGRSHAQEYVISPKRCTPLSGRGVKAESGAQCLRIVKDGKEVARGRVIDQSSGRVWLWVKQPWRVIAVPIDGATLEQVDLDS